MNVQTNFLSITWSTSRGRDTYGYNICRLDSSNTGRRYRCNGGGYDMVGTVVADWLCAEHQTRLTALHNRRASEHGACGIESVRQIAEAVGISMSSVVNRRGHVTGYMVTDYGSAEAMIAAQQVAA